MTNDEFKATLWEAAERCHDFVLVVQSRMGYETAPNTD